MPWMEVAQAQLPLNLPKGVLLPAIFVHSENRNLRKYNREWHGRQPGPGSPIHQDCTLRKPPLRKSEAIKQVPLVKLRCSWA